MQADILSEIRKMKNVRDVVLLTHNIDFIFLQTVLMAALKRCGHPSLTIFADAQCVQEAYGRQADVIKDLGSRYRVIPVTMSPGFRFHPKAILLSGDSDSCLYVGSGNLTFGGLRENGEIWKKIECRGGEVPAEMVGLQHYLQAIFPYVGLSDEVESDVAEIFNEDRHRWVKAMPEQAEGVWYQPGPGESLLTSMEKKLDGCQVKAIYVCTPYFDENAHALNVLSERFAHPPIEVYLQSGRSTLLKSAADSLSDNIVLKCLQAKRGLEACNRFVHAKWYAFDTGEGIEFFSGSANCSNAALLLTGDRGNAELMVESTLSYEQFNYDVLRELIIGDEKPLLVEKAEDKGVTGDIKTSLCITAARYDNRQLLVSYRCVAPAVVSGLKVDELEMELSPSSAADGRLQIDLPDRPRSIALVGDVDGEKVTSAAMWVDDESLLRYNSTSRQVADAIQQLKEVGEDDPKRWIMLFELFNQDIEQRSSHEVALREREGKEGVKPVKLHKDILLSSQYSHTLSLPSVALCGHPQSQSLYSLLLSSFGLNGQIEPEEQEKDIGQDQVDEVDLPDKTPPPFVPKQESAISKNQRTRLLKLVSNIIDKFCEYDYFLNREAQLLSRDFQMIAVLLRKLYSMKWIEENTFFELTHKLWSQVFFSAGLDCGKGLLQQRMEASADQNQFIEQFVSSNLLAALYGWFSAVRLEVVDAYSYRFILSQMTAMGRCPWLWYLDDEGLQLMMQQLVRIWEDSPCPHITEMDMVKKESQFITLIHSLSRKGMALARFENEMSGNAITLVRNSVTNVLVNKGDILWQGSAGFCVALEDSQDKDYTKALPLQKPEKVVNYRSEMLLPLRALLTCSVLFSKEFFHNEKPQLDAFMERYALSELIV